MGRRHKDIESVRTLRRLERRRKKKKRVVSVRRSWVLGCSRERAQDEKRVSRLDEKGNTGVYSIIEGLDSGAT